MNHDLLLDKMYKYCFRGKAYDLLQSYLECRKQIVNVNNNNGFGQSEWKEIKRGVPQGSNLRPLLFKIFINDLPSVINNDSCTVILFADDTSIIIHANTPTELNVIMDEVLEKVKD